MHVGWLLHSSGKSSASCLLQADAGARRDPSEASSWPCLRFGEARTRPVVSGNDDGATGPTRPSYRHWTDARGKTGKPLGKVLTSGAAAWHEAPNYHPSKSPLALLTSNIAHAADNASQEASLATPCSTCTPLSHTPCCWPGHTISAALQVCSYGHLCARPVTCGCTHALSFGESIHVH